MSNVEQAVSLFKQTNSLFYVFHQHQFLCRSVMRKNMKVKTNKPNKKIFGRTIVFALLLSAFNIMSLAASHRYHTTFTRIDQNRQENLLEITIQVFSHDLEPTLEKRIGENIDLENTPNIDKILLDYLKEKFVLRTKNGDVKKLNWVGKDFKADTIYFYVEVPFEGNVADLSLQNTLFFESFREQINYVLLLSGDQKADLVYKVGKKFKQFEFKENTSVN